MEDQNNSSQNMVDKNGSAGPIIGVIIILAIIILGGVYFWNERSKDLYDQNQVNGKVESITAQDESDDVASIEADLNATEIDSLDSELNASY